MHTVVGWRRTLHAHILLDLYVSVRLRQDRVLYRLILANIFVCYKSIDRLLHSEIHSRRRVTPPTLIANGPIRGELFSESRRSFAAKTAFLAALLRSRR